MKKILFALVAIALVAVSCKKNPTEDPKKDDPAKKEKPTMKLELVGQPDVDHAQAKCTPSSEDFGYYGLVFYKEDADNFDAESFAEYVYADIAEEGLTVKKAASYGTQTIDLPGVPGEELALMVTFVDDDENVYDMYRLDYKCPDLTTTDMTITISYSGGTDVTYTPTGTDPYMAWIMSDDLMNTFLSMTGLTSVTDELIAYILEGFAYSTYSEYGADPRLKGEKTESLEEYFAEAVPAGTKIHVMAAPMEEHLYVNGAIAYQTYNVNSAAEVRRHAAPAKAAKFMPRPRL